MKKDLLVTLANKNYINQAKQLFSSVYWNAGWKGDYMLLAHEIPEKELKWFRDKGIIVKKCKPLHDKKINKYHPAVLDKFYLFTPEFKKWRIIVYLDGDIIVRASLDRLTKVKSFSAVSDSYLTKLIYQFDNSTYEKKKIFDLLNRKYNLKIPSFNAGVIAFPSKIIKKEIFPELIELSKKTLHIDKYGEQTILNLYFTKWKRLPLVYNFWTDYIGDYAHIQLKNLDAIILHFIYFFSKRPWGRNDFIYDEWKENLEKAEYIDLNLTKSPRKRWNFLIEHTYCSYIKLRFLICSIPEFGKIIRRNFNIFAGKAGIFLKKYSPKTYKLLKKVIPKF
ncbi:hypothetical protein A3K82_02030 [Candidatus Pacearchaeota archaeon RBG_19FT_COMBO_34_9]|nr:MAG: hypothetical protein A3K82_02030 [Candidatus Pacearchaeota archaeon RBG_19FT_COMBO_34_9]OGJ15922.1 MAG: hypothetical protein A3K74_02375 [Candidatus Pacearchaeota archaeon RBG_13_33_26]